MEPNEVALSNAQSNLPQMTVQQLHSIIYLINAKPDRETKFFRQNKIVSCQNIIELQDSIQEKLANHEIVTNQISVVVILHNDRVLEYGDWEKFCGAKWQTDSLTKSITITWDFSVKIPRYEFPQRHTVKLRVGTRLKPKDMFELVMNHDGEEQLSDAFSHTICSVDFINPVISSEIFLIVERWHATLLPNYTSPKFAGFIAKHAQKINVLITYLFLVAATSLLYHLSLPFFKQLPVDTSVEYKHELFGWLLFTILIVYAARIGGQYWANFTTKTLDRLTKKASFTITHGDINTNTDGERKNKSIMAGVILKTLTAIVLNFVTYFFDKIMNAIQP